MPSHPAYRPSLRFAWVCQQRRSVLSAGLSIRSACRRRHSRISAAGVGSSEAFASTADARRIGASAITEAMSDLFIGGHSDPLRCREFNSAARRLPEPSPLIWLKTLSSGRS